MQIETQAGPVNNLNSRVSAWQAVPLSSVRFKSGFWQRRQSVNHHASLHHGYNMLTANGAFDHFRLCAGMPVEGATPAEGHEGHDTDVYKWLEAVAWELVHSPDAQLEMYLQETIPLIEAAQADDGYLITPVMLYHPEKKWADLHFGHEMYCAGHLIQAAVAVRRATGDERLLRVACRFADHIDSKFGPGKRSGTCGHPEVETALVELYREIGEKRYLDLAKFLVDERGQKRLSGLASYGPEYHQDHVPVRESREAIGHAVRQLYLATGVTDLFMETGEQVLIDRMEDLWWDITGSKLHITGGAGARFEGEAFGDPYELPTDQCYCETCAAIGNAMWNFRLLLITGQARFADAIEQAMYNAILCCPGLDGQHYFYVNPLMLRSSKFLRLSTNRPDSTGAMDGRPEWHGVACCPPNVMRFLSSLGAYFVTQSGRGVQLHQYGGLDFSTDLPNSGRVGFQVETEYPWQGQIRIKIAEPGSFAWRLDLRVPAWCERAWLEVNGERVEVEHNGQGYLSLDRQWREGDYLTLHLDVSPRLMVAHPRVDALRGCAALMKGPLVYCFESHDQPQDIDLLDIYLDLSRPLDEEWAWDVLDGITLVHAGGYAAESAAWGRNLYRSLTSRSKIPARPVRLTAIPYYAWGNRGLRSMRVWVPLLTGLETGSDPRPEYGIAG